MRPVSAKNVVIIGGGFAGITLAQKLERSLPDEYDIFLISKENFITYNPLLPEVVGASILPDHAVAPLRLMLKRTRIRMVTVTGIKTDKRTIEYTGDEPGALAYDHLVFACGLDANIDIVPGMAEHGLPLKTVSDAMYIRNRVISRLEQATIQPDIERRRWLTTFAIIGGGFSGVEVAGELRDFLSAAAPYYKNVRLEDCDVILLHAADRLIPELSPKTSTATLRILKKKGINVRLNVAAQEIDARGVVLTSDERVPAASVICTVGSTAAAFTSSLPFDMERNRMVVNADMSIPGFERLWALGDCALVPNANDGGISPPTAQFADKQARWLARNILATVQGSDTQAFSYTARFQLASLGHNRAVAEVFGICISGFVAWLMWRGVYLIKIPTLARKARLFLEWNWAMFFPPDIAHLGHARTQRTSPKANAQDELA